MAINGQSVVLSSVQAAEASIQVAVPMPVPGMGTSIQTCLGSRIGLAFTSLEGCGRWADSGSVNVLLLSRTAETAYEDVGKETTPRWKPAEGGWIVARLPTHGCGSGWHASEKLIELRIDTVTRRHSSSSGLDAGGMATGSRWARHTPTCTSASGVVVTT